jgi:hypothetical protein
MDGPMMFGIKRKMFSCFSGVRSIFATVTPGVACPLGRPKPFGCCSGSIGFWRVLLVAWPRVLTPLIVNCEEWCAEGGDRILEIQIVLGLSDASNCWPTGIPRSLRCDKPGPWPSPEGAKNGSNNRDTGEQRIALLWSRATCAVTCEDKTRGKRPMEEAENRIRRAARSRSPG